MECKCGCENEVVSSGTKPRLFYSDACRKRYNRTNFQEQTDRRAESQADESKRTEQSGQESAVASVAIPGDEDYDGVCRKSTGHMPDYGRFNTPEQEASAKGRWMVVKPDPIPVKDMTRIELEQKIRAYPNDRWVNSPEHKELMRRLNTMTIKELESEGYHIPAWKKAS